LAADVHARYYSRSSLSSLWRQYYQYGFWKVRVLQKHPLQMRPRQFAPPLFVAALLISVLLALSAVLGWFSLGWLPLAFLAGSYLLVNLAAASLTAAQTGWRYLPVLPVVFAILHLSYGLGFLAGLIRFASRWGHS
jgi:succinoglycan biosynthesis protein ExoA